MARHLTKNELLAQMREVSKREDTIRGTAFATISILINYTLWKSEKWGQTKLTEYNRRMSDLYCSDPSDEEIEKMHQILVEKFNIPIEIHLFKECDNPYKKSKAYRYTMNQRLMEVENQQKIWCRRCLIMSYRVLMDMGYGNKRLNRVKDYANQILNSVMTESGIAMKMSEELALEMGIGIEMPTYKPRIRY